MAIKWWQWRNIQEKLRLFGVAVQGPEPYRIEFADDPGLTGLTDFENRLVRVNPDLIPGLKPREAYDITKAVLCHEAGHRRFTTPTKLSPVVHMVSNILEDQRIESLMMEEFAGTRSLIYGLTRAMYDQNPELESTDDPGQVVAAALQHRWAVRLGFGLKGPLSAVNQERWEKVRPLVEQAWVADSSTKVDRIALEIVKILGLREDQVPAWVIEALDQCKGNRKKGDAAESGSPGAPGRFRPADEPSSKDDSFDGEPLPHSSRAGMGRHPIEPKPYLELEQRARPLAKELIKELEIDPVDDAPEPVDRGGRLSVRQYLRDRARPFLAAEGESQTPPVLAVRVVIDHSTSMNTRGRGGSRTRMESAAEGVMGLHLACVELGVNHVVTAAPQQIELAGSSTGERGKALLAGLVPAQTGYEDIAIAIERAAEWLGGVRADIRLILVVHDGYPNDGEKAKKLCAELKRRVGVIGLLLDPDEGTRNAMIEIFGADRLVACSSRELPGKLAAVLRNVRGV